MADPFLRQADLKFGHYTTSQNTQRPAPVV